MKRLALPEWLGVVRLSWTTACALTLTWSSGCAHREGTSGRGSGSQLKPASAVRFYDVDEAGLRTRVSGWFLSQGIALAPSPDDPHCLASREKETSVGVVKGVTPQGDRSGNPTVPAGIEQDTERLRTSTWGETSRTGSREFAAFRAEINLQAQGSLPPHPIWEQDRAVLVERDSFLVCFAPVTANRTGVRILRQHGSDWDGSVEKSLLMGTSPTADRSAPLMTTLEDAPREAALEEFLDSSEIVEVAGSSAVFDSQSPRTLVPPRVPEFAQAGVAVAQVRCDEETSMKGVSPGAVVLLSDPTGTTEAPKLFEAAVCAALRRGLPVTVALSLWASEQARVDQFLDSPGSPADVEALLGGDFWIRPWQDGRSSRSTVELLERLRARRARGEDVAVLASDAPLNGNARTAFVSASIQDHRRRHPGRVILGLFSNTQASAKPGTTWDEHYLPVGFRLASAGVPVRSYDVSFVAGAHWACRVFGTGKMRCGTWGVAPGPKQRAANPCPGVREHRTRSAEGFDGLWCIGAVTPSPPAHGDRFRDEGD